MVILKVLIVLALLATIATLVSGIASMARGGDYDLRHSGQLMAARVGMQGLTLLLALIALALTAR